MRMFNSAKAVLKAVSFITTIGDKRRKEGRKEGRKEERKEGRKEEQYGERDEKMIESGCERRC